MRVILINAGYFFEKCQELIKVRLFLGAKKLKFQMISFAIKFSKLYSLEVLEVHDGFF
jgi:hypothetical protein